MLWTEIIAQIDREIDRLQRARELLSAAPATTPASARRANQASKTRKPRKKAPKPRSKQPKQVDLPAAAGVESHSAAPPVPAPIAPEPPIQLVPPRRRFERRSLKRSAAAEKVGQRPPALSGTVHSGPIVVSAEEARKAQERFANPPAPPPPSRLPSTLGSERSLGSLIEAMERNSKPGGVGNV